MGDEAYVQLRKIKLVQLGKNHENLAQDKSLNPIICSITPRGQTLPEAVNKTKHVFNLERKHVFSLGRSYEEKLALSSIQFTQWYFAQIQTLYKPDFGSFVKKTDLSSIAFSASLQAVRECPQ